MSSPLTNHVYNLTTEEPRYTDFNVPTPADFLDGFITWHSFTCSYFLQPQEASYLSYTSMCAMQDEAISVHNELSLYDYLAAVQGDTNAALPRDLDHFPAGDFTLKSSGAAYYGGKLHSDTSSWLVTNAWQESYDVAYVDEAAYDCAVAAAALGVETADLPCALRMVEGRVTSAGNALSWYYRPVGALSYSEAESAMSTECLHELESYFIDLAAADDMYAMCVERKVLYDEVAKTFGALHVVHLPLEMLSLTVPEGDDHPFGMVYMNEEDFNVGGPFDDDDDDYFATDKPDKHIDAQEFVAKLEVIDISEIPAGNMKCMHCWSNFGETDEEMIELKSGEVKADNSPVKLSCPHGHLIGKTCLMQLIDADIHLCPQCRVDVVALV